MPRDTRTQKSFSLYSKLKSFSLSFLFLDSKVGSVVTKVCFGFCCGFLLILTALSLVGGQSVYSSWSLESTVQI